MLIKLLFPADVLLVKAEIWIAKRFNAPHKIYDV